MLYLVTNFFPCRQLYLKKFQSKVDKKTEIPKPRLSYQDSMELCETVDEEFFEFKNVALTTSALTKIHFAENAAEQKNFPVALKNLKDIYKVFFPIMIKFVCAIFFCNIL